MKNININHLRVIKKFSGDGKKHKVSEYEKFLSNFVSTPSARKIIKELIENKIVSVSKSENDLRVKHLEVIDNNIDKYL